MENEEAGGDRGGESRKAVLGVFKPQDERNNGGVPDLDEEAKVTV